MPSRKAEREQKQNQSDSKNFLLRHHHLGGYSNVCSTKRQYLPIFHKSGSVTASHMHKIFQATESETTSKIIFQLYF